MRVVEGKDIKDFSNEMSDFFRNNDFDLDENFIDILKVVNKKISTGLDETDIDHTKKVEISSEYRMLKKEIIRQVKSGEISSKSDVSSFFVRYGENKDLKENLKQQEVLSLGIDDNFWLENEDILKPSEGIIYRGGTARVLLRRILGIQEESADNKTDVDVFISQDHDIDDVASMFSCDHEGISQIESFEEKDLHFYVKNVDTTLNQVLVLHDNVYFTDKCRETLETKIGELIPQGDNLFGEKTKTLQTGELIYTIPSLFRILSFVIRGKLNGFTIREDNISTGNIEALGGLNKYFIIILKKAIAQSMNNSGEINEETLQVSMYRFSSVLKQLGYIQTDFEVFDFLSQEHKAGPVLVHDSYLHEFNDDGGDRDLRWKLGKVTSILVKSIIPDNLDNYTLDSSNIMKTIEVHSGDTSSFYEHFSDKWEYFYKGILTEDERKKS